MVGHLVQALALAVAGSAMPPLQSVSLWENPVLSARLIYDSPASLTDENLFTVVFDNQSGAPIQIDQAFLQLDADRFDAVSGKLISTGGVAGGVLYIGTLKPGVTQVRGDVCAAANGGLDLPPKSGYSIEMIVHCDARLKDRRIFQTSDQGAKFHLDWVYPSADEIRTAKVRLRHLLENPQHTYEHANQLNAVMVIPEVTAAFTADELLAALGKRTDSIDGRNLVAWMIERQYPSNPTVVAYYLDRLTAGDRNALTDIEGGSLWNKAWIQPIAANFERTGESDFLRVLGFHRKDWVNDTQMTAQLSAALLRFRPLLSKKPSELSRNQLYEWGQATREAAIVSNRSIIPVLSPALDDKRAVSPPLTQQFIPSEIRDRRVCDWAAMAILTILDGSPNEVYKRAGVTLNDKNAESHSAELDRVVEMTKARLR